MEFLCVRAGPPLPPRSAEDCNRIDSGQSGGPVTQHASLDAHALVLSSFLIFCAELEEKLEPGRFLLTYFTAP